MRPTDNTQNTAKADQEADKAKAYSDPISAFLGNAIHMTADATETIASVFNQISSTTTAVGTQVGTTAQQWIEQGTETIGHLVTPIANNQMVQTATHIPGVKWLLAALGQVNVDKVQQDVARLRYEFPLEQPEELAHRVIVDTALRAGQIGILTNLAPPLALSLLAIDITAVSALQAEMIYRIAAIYDFPLQDPTRRGEVLAIWSLLSGGSSMLKTGLSAVEVIPVIGPVTGATGNAALLYSLGQLARHFYAEKRKAVQTQQNTVSTTTEFTSEEVGV